VLALLEFDLPSTQTEVLSHLEDRFRDALNLITIKLAPPPAYAPRTFNVLDQLNEAVSLPSKGKEPDALVITGLESLFPETFLVDGEVSEDLVRAIQPLNLGRNVLAQRFPCPVLLCLPPAAMATFLRVAPDLYSGKSGFFQFQSDLNAVREEIEQAAQAGTGWRTLRRLRKQNPENLQTEAYRLELLIADATALRLEDAIIAPLYRLLGWVALALRNGAQARGAFNEMLRLAHEKKDRRLAREAERAMRRAEC
jgi:hypothetical protein